MVLQQCSRLNGLNEVIAILSAPTVTSVRNCRSVGSGHVPPLPSLSRQGRGFQIPLIRRGGEGGFGAKFNMTYNGIMHVLSTTVGDERLQL